VEGQTDKQTYASQYFAKKVKKEPRYRKYIPSVIRPSPDDGIQKVSGIRKDRRTLGMIRA